MCIIEPRASWIKRPALVVRGAPFVLAFIRFSSAMHTVQHVGRMLPSSRSPVAPTPGSGNQVVNAVEDTTAITAQLSSKPSERFYPLSGASTTIDNVDGSTP